MSELTALDELNQKLDSLGTATKAAQDLYEKAIL